MPSSLRFLFALCLGALPPLAGTAADSAKAITVRDMLEQSGYVSVPFRVTEGNHLEATGTVGRTTIRCGIDTGWGDYSAILHRVGRKLGREIPTPAGYDAKRDDFVSVEGFTLGNYSFASNSFRLFNLSTHGYDHRSVTKHMAVAAARPKPTELMLGLRDLVGHHAIINYPQKLLHLRPEAPNPARYRAIHSALEAANYARIEMDTRQSGVFLVPCRLEDEAGQLVVDSGAFATAIDLQTVTRLKGKAPREIGSVRGVKARESKLGLTILSKFAIGTWARSNHEILAVDLSPWGLGADRPTPLSEVKGLLGGDVLGTSGAIVDCGGGQLFLAKPRK